MIKMTKDNFTSPEGDFETRIALVIVLSLIIFVIVVWNEGVKKNMGEKLLYLSLGREKENKRSNNPISLEE